MQCNKSPHRSLGGLARSCIALPRPPALALAIASLHFYSFVIVIPRMYTAQLSFLQFNTHSSCGRSISSRKLRHRAQQQTQAKLNDTASRDRGRNFE